MKLLLILWVTYSLNAKKQHESFSYIKPAFLLALINVLLEIPTKPDRFTRSTIDGINTIKELFERGINVHVLNMGLVEDTPTGRQGNC